MHEPPYETAWTRHGPVDRIRARGAAVLSVAATNRGTAFTPEQRRALGLTGLLPAQVADLDAQVERSYAQLCGEPDAPARHRFLAALRDRNEVVFHRLLLDHLDELLPVVYTPTIGTAIEHYSADYHRPHGVYLSLSDSAADIEAALRAYAPSSQDVDLVVATDGAGILGIGAW